MFVSGRRSLDHVNEAPKPKHQISNNIQCPISNDLNANIFELWVIGTFLEFAVWNLEFEIRL